MKKIRGIMAQKKKKIESVNEWKLLNEASKEVESWPKWLQKNAELLFEKRARKAYWNKRGPYALS